MSVPTTVSMSDLYAVRVEREATAAERAGSQLKLDADWLASDPFLAEDEIDHGGFPLPVDNFTDLLSEASAKVSHMQTYKPKATIARTEGCTADHDHEWHYVGDFGQVSPMGIELPAWDFDRCVNPLIFKCGSAGLDNSRVFLKACGSSNASKCAPCEMRYRMAVRTIVRERLLVIKPGKGFFLTISAPGAHMHCIEHPYYSKKDGKWHPSIKCNEADGRKHVWCACTTRATALTSHNRIAEWNSVANAHFNDFITDLRRQIPGLFDVSYFRAAEVQERGALHFHIVLVVRSGTFLYNPNMTDADGKPIEDPILTRIRGYAIAHKFGHEVDLQPIADGVDDKIKAARYVAKYVSKALDTDNELPADDEDGAPVKTVLALPVRRTAQPRPAAPGEVEDLISLPVHPQSDKRPKFVFRRWTVSRNWGLNLARVYELQRVYQAEGADASKELLQRLLSEADEMAAPPLD